MTVLPAEVEEGLQQAGVDLLKLQLVALLIQSIRYMDVSMVLSAVAASYCYYPAGPLLSARCQAVAEDLLVVGEGLLERHGV